VTKVKVHGWRARLRTSFLERNQRIIGTIGVVAILIGTAGALLLSGGVLARTYPVRAVFTDAGGIASGDQVTVAGLDAGTVKGIHIEQGRVVMDLAVNKGVDMPADSRAEVVIETLLGKRSVNLVAGQDTAHTLEEVGSIPMERTVTPIDITDLNDISVRLLNESDADALNELLRQVTTITQGKSSEITELVSGLADLTEAVDSRREELSGLITALRTLAETFGERDETLVSLIDHLDPVLANLSAHQEDLARLLVSTDGASHEVADLIQRNRPVLDDTLNSLHTDLKILDRHQLDLAATVAYLEQSVQGYASVAYSQGNCGTKQPPCTRGLPNRWASIFVQSLGPLGVDALLGPCGLVDQLIDQVLGTDCNDSGSGSKPKGNSQDEKPTDRGGLDLPGLPELTEPLPGDVGDLVDSVLGGRR
jgi:phospholipid/cholesterol/gamma-HCH transport system substrate-binding protein